MKSFCAQENEGEGDSADPWTGSDRDYLYDELLQVNFFENDVAGTEMSRTFVFRECLES